MINETIILAGGLGTRLQGVVSDVPKSMAPVNGRPFLEYQLDFLDKWGMKHVILSVGYKHEIIKDHFKDAYKSIRLSYAIEEEPLGTGGAVLYALNKVDGPAAFILNGDTYFDVNMQRMNDFRRAKETNVVIGLRFVPDVSRYGQVEFGPSNRIEAFREKGDCKGEGYINGGTYLISKKYLLNFDLPKKFSLESDFFEKYCYEEAFYALRCFSYFRDIGIPEDYNKAQYEFKGLGN